MRDSKLLGTNLPYERLVLSFKQYIVKLLDMKELEYIP